MHVLNRIRESTKLKKAKYTFAQSINRIEPSENLLLFCMPRGGSTWLTEVLAENSKLPVLWEPLHLRYAPSFQDINLGWEQVMPEDGNWPELLNAFEKLFQGKILNDWNCRVSPARSFVTSRQMIIKFCRANGMLLWLTKNFSFKYKPVLLLRHPFAVVASQMRHMGFNSVREKISVPQTPHNDFFAEHRGFLASIDSKPQRQVAVWCIQNVVPLQVPVEERRWITVYYEDLLEHPERELRKILDAWGLEFHPGMYDQIRRPSMTTVGERSFSDINTQLGRWKEAFSDEEIAKMLDVLEYFEIKTYGIDPRPVDLYR